MSFCSSKEATFNELLAFISVNTKSAVIKNKLGFIGIY
jgi:hypothetical protein